MILRLPEPYCNFPSAPEILVKEPLVSVIVASYNHEKYIGQTLISILNQTYKNIEVLVLDDGSPDNSFGVIQHVAKHDHRIKCWRQQNRGAVATFNALADAAQGEYIAQIGSDDLWLPHRLEWGLEDMRNDSTLSGTFCSFLTVDNTLTPIKPVDPLYFRHLKGRVLVEHLIMGNYVGALTAFLKTDAVRKARPFANDLKSCHDWDLWLRLSMVGELNLRPHIGALYRWHGDNMSSKNKEFLDREVLQVMETVSPVVAKHYNLSPEIHDLLLEKTAQFAMNNNNPARAIEILVNKSEQTPLSDKECIMLLYSLHLDKKRPQALELGDILYARKDELDVTFQRDLEKIMDLVATAS